MDRVIGGVLGLAAFVAVAAVGLAKGLPLGACAWRALLALVLGTLVGWLVFGKVGLSVVREAAASPPPAPPAGDRPGAPAAPSRPSDGSER